MFVGAWFLILWNQGDLVYYILPRFNALVVGTAIFLLVGGFLLLLFGRNWHEIKYHLDPKSFFSFFLLFCLVLIFPPQPLSSHSVSKRGVEINLSNIKLTTPVEFQIDSTKRTFADWVNIIGTSKNVRQYVDESVAAKGFVYRDDDLLEDEFYLARFLLRCCSADARPVVLRVKSPLSSEFENDQWIDLKGAFALDKNPKQPLYIRLESYEKIPVPKIPYIY